MKLKPFTYLLAICIILGGVSYLVLKKDSPSQQKREMGAKLLKDFPVNDVAAISMVSPDGTVALKKGKAQWVVENRDGYPADFSKISDLAKKVKSMKIGRSFEATPDVQDRLALNPPGQQTDANAHQGTQLVFSDSSAKTMLEMVISRKEASAPGPALQYVLLPDHGKVYQVDKSYRFLGRTPADWIEQQPLDVKAADIYQVTCFDAAQKPIYTLQRKAKGSEPQFLELPDGQKSLQAKIDLVFDALSPLSIEDVAAKKEAAAEKTEDPQQHHHFEYQLYNGLVYTVWPTQTKSGNNTEPDNNGQNGDTYQLKIQAAYREPISIDKPESEKKEDITEAPKGEKQEAPPPPPELAKQANSKLSPWIYTISKWVYDSFVTDPQSFIEKKEAA
jgi:hypothetical protein